jgi:hypothetical protein
MSSTYVRMLTISTLIAIPGLLGTFGSNASATVSCHDSGCNGKSPVSMGCESDAVSLNFVVLKITRRVEHLDAKSLPCAILPGVRRRGHE